MEIASITTPFGRRALSLGMLASQMQAQEIAPDKSVEKWKLFRALCEARAYFGISDRALAVLNALLTFYPKNEISEAGGFVVFPSNVQLSVRAHGITPATLRRHLAALVEAGLLIRKDSPNGKRYARKDREGQLEQAFGFSLAPLLARSEEIEKAAAEVLVARQRLRSVRERLSLCRRDIAKLIETALEETIAGDWPGIHLHFRDLVTRIPRNPEIETLASILEELEMLRDEIVNLLERRVKAKKPDANESQSECHIQNSKPKTIYESEPASEQEQGGKLEPERLKENVAVKAFPLRMVLQACPEMIDYSPGGDISSWRELMAAAVVVRSTLGISPSAYQSACEALGPENTAAVIGCILARAGHINSAGGYLRDLTRRAQEGEFSLGPMLMALIRSNAGQGRQAG